MQIAFVCNTKKSGDRVPNQDELEYDSQNTVDGIIRAIETNGHLVRQIEADRDCFEKLKKARKKIDLVFNIAEGVAGDARESQVPTYCEVLGLKYTHSTPTCHAVSLNKSWCKMILAANGIRVPRSVVIRGVEVGEVGRLRFPLILKPNMEGSSKGVFDANVVANIEELKDRLSGIRAEEGNGDLLAEEYIEGREFTVSLLGNGPTKVLPIVEQRFDFLPPGMKRIAGYELKWIYEDGLKDLSDAYDCPAKLAEKEVKIIESTSKNIFETLGVRDCARIDYRMTNRNELYFIEINTLPGMIPDPKVISYFPLSAKVAGINFEQLVGLLIQSAMKRYGLNT